VAGCIGAGSPGQVTGQVAGDDEVSEGVPGGGVNAVEGGVERLPHRFAQVGRRDEPRDPQARGEYFRRGAEASDDVGSVGHRVQGGQAADVVAELPVEVVAEGERCWVESVTIGYRADAGTCGLERAAPFGVPGLLERHLPAGQVRRCRECAEPGGHAGDKDDVGGAGGDAAGAAQVSSERFVQRADLAALADQAVGDGLQRCRPPGRSPVAGGDQAGVRVAGDQVPPGTGRRVV